MLTGLCRVSTAAPKTFLVPVELPAESGEARIDGLTHRSLHPTVLRTPSTPQTLLSFRLRQKQESQHAQHGEAERGFLAVPGMRLPHEEILSADNLKPR